MRKIIIAGNWKMNKKLNEAVDLVKEINEKATSSANLESVLIFPSFPYISSLKSIIDKEFIHLGAQNLSAEEKGAYTGEVSAEMIKSLGIDFVLIGHSERRQYFAEDHELLKRKLNVSLAHDLTPVFCCGESLEDRQAGRQSEIILKQLTESVFHLEVEEMQKVIIAYEPVWAIGTGLTATIEQADEMHEFIRKSLKDKYGEALAEQTHILYGGSCNSGNSKELFSSEHVDGGLIGGASLKADEFLTIISNVYG